MRPSLTRRAFLTQAIAATAALPLAARADADRTRLILLGTAGGPTPKKTRAAPSQAIVIGDRTYVVDCGNGVARQLVLAGVPLASIHPHEIARGGRLFEDDRVTVHCCLVDHPEVPIALAYRFDGHDRSIVISGDTRRSAALIALARNADVLVHEALYVSRAPGAEGSALRRHVLQSHTPVEEVGRIATEAGVKMLVLSHFVPGETPPVSDEEWLTAARKHYSGPIVVGRDLLEI